MQEVDTWQGHWLGVVGVQCHGCDLDLTFDLVVVTLTYKILPRLYLGNHKVSEVDTW